MLFKLSLGALIKNCKKHLHTHKDTHTDKDTHTRTHRSEILESTPSNFPGYYIVGLLEEEKSANKQQADESTKQTKLLQGMCKVACPLQFVQGCERIVFRNACGMVCGPVGTGF